MPAEKPMTFRNLLQTAINHSLFYYYYYYTLLWKKKEKKNPNIYRYIYINRGKSSKQTETAQQEQWSQRVRREESNKVV